jgi:hypothetical protein
MFHKKEFLVKRRAFIYALLVLTSAYEPVYISHDLNTDNLLNRNHQILPRGKAWNLRQSYEILENHRESLEFRISSLSLVFGSFSIS